VAPAFKICDLIRGEIPSRGFSEGKQQHHAEKRRESPDFTWATRDEWIRFTRNRRILRRGPQGRKSFPHPESKKRRLREVPHRQVNSWTERLPSRNRAFERGRGTPIPLRGTSKKTEFSFRTLKPFKHKLRSRRYLVLEENRAVREIGLGAVREISVGQQTRCAKIQIQGGDSIGMSGNRGTKPGHEVESSR